MAVKIVGETGRSLERMRTIAVVLFVSTGAWFYLYGPAVMPTLQHAAAERCNEVAGGNFRSYRLHWVTGTQPHWVCGTAARPGFEPVDLGWMVVPNPF